MGLITVMGQRKVADILLNLEVEGRKQNTAQEAAGADYDHIGNAHGTLSSSDITSRAGGTCLQWVADTYYMDASVIHKQLAAASSKNCNIF
jgi:hypothetical protein